MLPRILPNDELPAANTLLFTVTQLGAIAGPLVAGVVLTFASVGTLYLVDTICLIASIWAAFMLPRLPVGDGPGGVRGAIRAVRRGESAFDSHSAAAVVASLAAPATGPDGTDLTAREREVLALLARGLSNEAIGRELYISATTAKFHVGNVLRKLSVSRRAEAVYAGSKLGLI